MYDKPIKNLLVMSHIATGYPQSIMLTQEELALAKDKSETINESWYKLCESVNQRLGIDMQGFELETLGGRPIH